MKMKGRIFLLDDDELIITMLSRALNKAGFDTQIHTSGKDIISKIEAWQPDVVMLDIHLGEDKNGLDILNDIKAEKIDTQVVMLTGDDTAETAIKAMKIGAADYLTKPFNVDEVILVIKGLLEKSKLQDEISYLRKTRLDYVLHEMVGESTVVKELIEQANRIAAAGVQTILITGESGTGKEVLARNIHNWINSASKDADNVPYIAVNCTALPDNLIESELFGHSKGAFTDAKTDKKGMFELADGGSILLDEIGDMRPDLQSKFLRVLEERSVRRLGGKVDLPLDLTVIATTNRDLKQAVADNEFREDLFFRLSSFSINMPPLRDRREDIPLLARYFLDSFRQQYARSEITGFEKEAEKMLYTYDWPGNIRELKNVIERCVVLENNELISSKLLPMEISRGTVGSSEFVERRKCTRLVLPEEGISLDEVEKDLIKQALERAGNNQTKAAKLLNITYDSLRYQVKKFGLM